MPDAAIPPEIDSVKFDANWDFDSVANYPVLDYSLHDVRRAGEALRGHIPMNSDTEREAALKVFEIANSWRDSHLYPMKKVRAELRGQLQKLKLAGTGLTVARLKTMPSIRRKLRSIPAHLTQIQDLAGCRVIVPSMDVVRRIIDFNRGECFHVYFDEKNYMENPKEDGYRSFHRIL